MGLLSGIASLVFGGQKKTSNSKQSGTTATQPYAPVIPYLDQYLGSTADTYNSAPQISPYEQSGYDMLSNVANGPSPLTPAIAENNDTLSGKYLTPDNNPYLAAIAQRAAGMAGATSNATFAGAGRTGSGLAGFYAGKGAADAADQLYYTNYNDERSRMGSAVTAAPTLTAGQYVAPQAMISAGQNISARPFDINAQQGNILSTIGQLGQQGQYTGQQTNYAHNPGIVGTILNSFTNKLFPGGGSGPF